MRVHWTDTAQVHLDAIHACIVQDSAEYAIRTIDRLTRRSQQIADFPNHGHSDIKMPRQIGVLMSRINGQPHDEMNMINAQH